MDIDCQNNSANPVIGASFFSTYVTCQAEIKLVIDGLITKVLNL